MTSITISDNDLQALKDQVVIVTGGSSGIGLATTKLLLSLGSKVIIGDLNPPPSEISSQVAFVKVNVTSWQEQLVLFKKAIEQYGHIDHVFANAGIRPTVTLLEDDVDENGDPAPPNLRTFDVNLIGCLYTVKLAIHYLKKSPKGGSIVVTASGSSFTRFSPTDYTMSKHAVLGLSRALYNNLSPNLPIRCNAVAPSWTDTNIITPELVAMIGDQVQTADVVARSVALLMADGKRHGELIYSGMGKFVEIDAGETGLLKHLDGLIAHGGVAGSEQERLQGVMDYVKKNLVGEGEEGTK